MAKILCRCGAVIYDQTDSIRNKGYFLADQDYTDFFEEIEGKLYEVMSSNAIKYFHELFQCTNCNSLILFRNGTNQGIFFTPAEKDKSENMLSSYLGKEWAGFMSANFTDGKGEIYWSTNYESGFRQDLSLEELKKIYHAKFEELKALNILRHSFLRINGKTEHQFALE